MDSHPNEMPDTYANVDVLRYNPNILIEQLRRGETFQFTDAERYFTDETLRSIADEYLRENGPILTEDTSRIYTSNPYIIEAVLVENPQCYDYVDIFSNVAGSAEHIELLEKAWKEGRYTLSNKTPYSLLVKEEVFNYCLENRVDIIASSELLVEKLNSSQFTIAQNKYREAILSGEVKDYSLYSLENFSISPKEVGYDPKSKTKSETKERSSNDTRGSILRTIVRKKIPAEEIPAELAKFGITTIMEAGDPEFSRANPRFVRAALMQDFANIEFVSPVILLDEDEQKWIVEQAIANNYDVNEDSLYIFRKSKDFAFHIASNKPEQLKFFDKDMELSDEEQKRLVDILISSDTPILLGNDTLNVLRSNEEYIRFSLENAKKNDFQEIIDNIDFSNIGEEYRDELIEVIVQKIIRQEYVFGENSPQELLEDDRTLMPILQRNIGNLSRLDYNLSIMPLDIQRKIYTYYQAQSENGEISPELESLMHQNTFYMQNYIFQNLDRINEISIEGIGFSPDFRTTLAEGLLISGYEITQDTPSYILSNREFLAGYIIQNPDRMKDIDMRRLIALITRENLKESQRVRELIEILPDNVETPISRYYQYWGKERTIELVETFGDAVKYLNKGINYTTVQARDELVGLLKRGAIYKEDDAMSLITNLGIKLEEEDFKNLGNSLAKSSKLFEKLLPQNPEYIKYYAGENEEIFKKAIELGAFHGKTVQEAESFLNYSARSNSTVITELLENESKEWISIYTGTDDMVFETAVKVGSFEDLTPEQIDKYLRTGRINENAIIMQYLIENYSPKYIEKYRGRDKNTVRAALKQGAFEMLSREEIEKFLQNSHVASSDDKVITYLIETASPDYILQYTGAESKVFVKSIEAGAFDDKTPEELEKIFENSNISRQSDVMKYLIEKYTPDVIEHYTGYDEEVYKKALEMGYRVDVEKLREHQNLLGSSTMFEEVASKDPQCYALKFKNMPREEIEACLDKIYADQPDFLTDTNKRVFSGLCKALNEDFDSGFELLKAFNPELVDTIGINNWRTLLRYSIRHPNLKDLIHIAEEHKLDDFLKTYKVMEPMISDDIALGINKFLSIASFYNSQPAFCADLFMAVENGEELSEVSRVNLQTLIHNSENYSEQKLDFSQLETLVSSDKTKFLEGIDEKDKSAIKSDLMQYLFNIDEKAAEHILEHDINSKVVAEILSGAKKAKNQVLQLEAEYMSVLVDTLEKIYYYNGEEGDLREFARGIYNADEKDIFQIRKEFVNIRETIRKFYERDAQEELTDIRSLSQNEKYYSMYEYDENGTKNQIKIVDISQMKHTIYCHKLGTTIDEMFDTDAGRPTICVSPETDLHEAFYVGESGRILVFDNIPNGSFIGSSPENMSSNGSIQENDYRVDAVADLLEQSGIRQSYRDEGHAETLLYRHGLIPVGIKMTGAIPTTEEIQTAKEFERKIKELTGEEVEIPLIKTQHQYNRIVKYQGNISEEKELAEFEAKAKQIQDMRRKFMGIVNLEEPEVAIRQDYAKEKYAIIDGEVYTVQRLDKTDYEQATARVGMNLERLVHGEDADNILDIQDITVDQFSVFELRRKSMPRDLWHYNREKGSFSSTTNSILLKEFLVDHLMCNYVTDNSSFSLGTENEIYPLSKAGAFTAVSDFKTKDGKDYTAMSYMYFDSDAGNNIYRRVFENYIMNPDESQILSQQELSDFVEKAKEISAMEDSEYLKMFEPILDTMYDDRKEEVLSVILARKESAERDAMSFVTRLQEARRIEQEPDIIEDASTIAFANDIHGNLAAVQSIIEDCKRTGKKTIYVLGDMIGFGAQSNECLDALRQASSEIEIKCILGNHEMYSLMGDKNFENTLGFDSYLTDQVRSELSPENREFLETLPISRRLIVEGKKVQLTHFPLNPVWQRDQDVYLEHGVDVTNSQTGLDQDYLIYGHEHRTESTTGNDVGTIYTVNNGKTTYFNLPSSGCVHGNNTSYVTISIEDGKIKPEVKPIEYDKAKNDRAIIETKNPKGHFFGVGGQDGR